MKLIGISSYPRRMKKLALALTLACLLGPASARAQNAYITNQFSNTVSVIDTATNMVSGVCVDARDVDLAAARAHRHAEGGEADGDRGVSVIDTATNTVSATRVEVHANSYHASMESVGTALRERRYDCVLMHEARVEWWYRQNLLLFASKAGLSRIAQSVVTRPDSKSMPLDVVHPACFEQFVNGRSWKL